MSKKITSPFFSGGGEMGHAIRNYDWQGSCLGDVTEWPQSLLTSVSNLLRTSFPMLVLWGEEFICFYNDAVKPSLDNRTLVAVGQPSRAIWKDSWDFIGPLLDDVLHTGKAVTFQDQPITFYRDGKIEDVYWTFCYSQILDDDGSPAGVLVTCMDTTDAVKTRQKTEASEMKMRSIIEHAPPSISISLFLGRELIIDTPNEAFIKTIGKGPDIEGKMLADLMPELENQSFLRYLDDVFTSGKSFRSSASPVTIVRDGAEIENYYDISFIPLLDANGNVYAIVDMSVDVTELVLAQRKIEEIVALRTRELGTTNASLNLVNKELTRSNANLEEFAHAASHDLKEPIRKIHYFTEFLKRQLGNKLGLDEQASLERIQRATQRMGELIEDLLLYSHVSQRPHEMESVDLNEVINRVLEDLDLEITNKNAKINVDALPVVNGYRRQLQQLFQNLLSNALKYSKRDTVPEIKIASVQNQKETGGYDCISISDNGIGFEEEYSDKIFQMFARLHGKTEYGGTGVGLSIVKKVVDNHNGLINVTSHPGEGSIFEICLPQQSG